jgi:large repetitive protein
MATDGATPYTWSLASGALPAGLSLNAATGEISGTPTTAGTANFTVQVTGANGLANTGPLSIEVLGGGPTAAAGCADDHDRDAAGDERGGQLRGPA